MKLELKIPLFTVLVGSVFVVASCNSRDSAAENQTPVAILAKGKEFIGVDTAYLVNTAYLQGDKEIPPEDMNKLKAIIYRIYANVRVEDGIYVLGIENGSEVNISEDVFNIYKKNIEDGNRFILSQRKEMANENHKKTGAGTNQVEVPEITQEYLNSLLE